MSKRANIVGGAIAISGIGVMLYSATIGNGPLPKNPHTQEANDCRDSRLIDDYKVNSWYDVATQAPQFEGFGEKVRSGEVRTITAANGSQVLVSIAEIDACRKIAQDEWNSRFSIKVAQRDKQLNVLFVGLGVVGGGGLVGLGINSFDSRRAKPALLGPQL